MMSRALNPARAAGDVPGVLDAHAAPAARPAPATRPGRDPAPAAAQVPRLAGTEAALE